MEALMFWWRMPEPQEGTQGGGGGEPSLNGPASVSGDMFALRVNLQAWGLDAVDFIPDSTSPCDLALDVPHHQNGDNNCPHLLGQ